MAFDVQGAREALRRAVRQARDRLEALGDGPGGPQLFRSIAVGALLLSAATGATASYAVLTPDCSDGACPSLDDLESYRPPEPPHVYDRNGALAGHLPGVRRVVVPLERIPLVLRDGFVAVEDRRFWAHGGVDFRAAFRALTRNVEAGASTEGASTITMQLARNIFASEVLRHGKWRRKAMEVRLAYAIESRLSKREILGLYLNQIYLGSGVYGVGAAARHFFDKEVAELTAAEAALIIGLAKNPEGYGPRAYPERARLRRDVVLAVLEREGVIEPDAARVARSDSVRTADPELVWDRGSHYAAAVRRELIGLLPEPRARDGVRVFTGLDPGLQAASERALEEQIRRIEEGEYGPYDHPTPADSGDLASGVSASPYLQGMVVAIDASTGAVRALVGGRDFSRSEFDRAFLARRQPGSAFKPFVLAAAVADGRPLTELVSVDPLTVDLEELERELDELEREELEGDGTDGLLASADPEEDSIWRLADFTPEGRDPEATLTLREALVRSSNVGAVRVGMGVGTGAVIRQARSLGISTPIPPYPSIFLGSAEVVPAELVAAFAAFENGGLKVRPHLVTRVESPDGEILWQARPDRSRVLDRRVAFLVRSVLQDVVDRGTGWRARGGGSVRGLAAGKTGTTNEGRDVWFVGMRPGLVTGVWLGFDRPRSIVPGATGGQLAAPAWADLMSAVPDSTLPSRDWGPPPGISSVRIDRSSGYLADESCPGELVATEYFLEGTEPSEVCPLHGRGFFDRVFSEVRGWFGGGAETRGGGAETREMRRLPR